MLILVLFSVICTFGAFANADSKVVCFYDSRSFVREGKLYIENNRQNVFFFIHSMRRKKQLTLASINFFFFREFM
jgi:hypothetical protein